jgi:hypothetical protein
MDEVDYHSTQEAIGIGQEMDALVAEYFGLPSDASEVEIDRALYKGTDCGAWFKFTETGVRVGTIVEGSDAEFIRNLDYPFTASEFERVIRYLEERASEAWKEANGAPI